jgi:glyoxylase-like metal-dependent hydrolase (beta-lactamase superfamily II)
MRLAILIAAAISLLPMPSWAQTASPVTVINGEAEKSDVAVQSLRGNVSVLTGSGGNIAVLAGPDGKLLVDSGIAVSKKKIAAALARIGPTGPKYVINTHWHWDHTDGNAWMHEAGATIIAHENTRKHLSQTSRVEDWNWTFPPAPPGALPTLLVNTQKTLTLDGETIVIAAYAPAHTDGDLWVRFEQAGVIVTGDTFWNGMYPFIDNLHGGGIDGMVRAVGATLERAGEDIIIVPGHGPVAHRADLVAFRDMLVTVRARVAKLKSQGRSLVEVIAAAPSKPYDSKWGGSVINPPLFIRLVYAGLEESSSRQAAKRSAPTSSTPARGVR